jgi:hypothetical protein
MSGTLSQVFLCMTLDPEQPHNIRRRIVTLMVDGGRHGAPLPAPPHITVTQHVG